MDSVVVRRKVVGGIFCLGAWLDSWIYIWCFFIFYYYERKEGCYCLWAWETLTRSLSQWHINLRRLILLLLFQTNHSILHSLPTLYFPFIFILIIIILLLLYIYL